MAFSNLNFTDPYPIPASLGDPVQASGDIVFTEHFETVEPVGERVTGVKDLAWGVPTHTTASVPFLRTIPGGFSGGMPGISIEFLAKFTTLPNLGCLLNGPGFNVGFFNDGTNAHLASEVYQSLNGVFIGHAFSLSDINLGLPDGKWHQYVITFDCHTLCLYIDGLVVFRDWQGNTANTIGPSIDGTNVPSATHYEIGGGGSGVGIGQQVLNNITVDELRLSSVALTPAQVQANYNNYLAYDTILYASPTGSGSGSSPSTPASLATCIAAVGQKVKIILLPGTYSGTAFQIGSGAVDPLHRCLIIGADGTSQAIVNVPTSSGSTSFLNGANYITLRNITFVADDQNAINIIGCSGIDIDCCRFSSAQAVGLSIDSSPSVIVQNCIVLGSTSGVLINASLATLVLNSTIYGAATGLKYTGASGSMSIVNNIFTQQTGECLNIATAAQSNIVGDGNIFDPAGGGNAAKLNTTSYSRTQLDAYRKAMYLINYPSDYPSPFKLGARGPDNLSFALAVNFFNQPGGDYRISTAPGNAIDTGVYSTVFSDFTRFVDPAPYDINGAARPVEAGCDSGAFEQNPDIQHSFTLLAPCITSASVYSATGQFLKSLWSGRNQSGSATAYWNGLDYNGSIAPNGTYQIRIVTHNMQYIWDGVAGNSSDDFNGPTVHSGFYPMNYLCFVSTKAFYCPGYNEGQNCFATFLTTTPQQVTFKSAANFELSLNVCATDGTWVYWGDAGIGNFGYIIPMLASDNSAQQFSGVTNTPAFGGYFGYSVGTPGGTTGLACQVTGNILFIANVTDNKIYTINKRTGVNIGTGFIDLSALSMSAVSVVARDNNDDLWVACKVSGSPRVVRLTGFGGTVSIAATITVVAPVGVGVDSATNNVLIADAGTSMQVKAYNASGASQWTFGQAGGYLSNGPAVANDKFFWQGPTFIAANGDGTFWVRDDATKATRHYDASRTFIEEIVWVPHSYVQTSDPNTPTRVCSQYLEYTIDYSVPLSGGAGWVKTNYWGYNLPGGLTDDLAVGSGLNSVITLNGHVFAVLPIGSAAGRQIVELTSSGVRNTGLVLLGSWDFGIEGDGGQTQYVQNGGTGQSTYSLKAYTGLDGSNNPTWSGSSDVAVVDAPWTSDTTTLGTRWNGDFPSLGSGSWRHTTGGNIISYLGDRTSCGYHLGGILPGATSQWQWLSSFARLMNGLGAFDNDVEYAGFQCVTNGRHVVFQLNGEFWHGAQANQFFHFLENGLFLGQYGTPNIFATDQYGSKVPGLAGNSFSPTVVLASGELYMWVNDESGHSGDHRWHLSGISTVAEQAVSVSIPFSNQVLTMPIRCSAGVLAAGMR